jgi:competence protein ComEC
LDDIQRKLELFDRQLTGGLANFHKQIISTTPLLFVAVGLIAGILLQSTLALSVWFWLLLLAICAISTVLFFVIQKIDSLSSYPLVLLSFCALICFFCLGAIRLTSFHQSNPDDISNFVTDERKLATIRGRIVTKPYINKNKHWQFARFTPTDPSSSFYLKVSEVETTDGWAKVSGTVRVYVNEPVLGLKVGDLIQAYCWLDRFEGATNPGQFDIAKYLARKNVFIAASIPSREGIELLEGSFTGTFTKIKRKVREISTQALLGDMPIEDRSRGLLEALLLGYRGNIDSKTYEAFRKTGLLHFISLSGMHLGIFMGIIWWLCKVAGLMKPTRAIICIIAICIFLLIVPPRSPTLRAAIIGWVFCASFLFHRKSNSLNTLSLAAIILLLIRPTMLFEAGWQLSFASVLGIILFADRIHFFLYEKITDGSWFKEKTKTKLFFRIISVPGPYILSLFAIGLAAWLGGAGILLHHFYTINPLTFIWTVVVFPFVAAILTVGYLKIILSLLLPTAAAVLGIIVNGLSDLLIWIVELLSSLDISQILIGHIPVALVILYYCLIAFAGFAYFQRSLIKKAICTVMVLAIIISLGTTKLQRTLRDNLVLTCLNVGHGQAILAQLPGKTNVLFDAGSLHKTDIGRKIVASFLDYSGINKINSIIISHNDVDHINGIPEIVEYRKVGAIYANDAFFSKTDQWGTAKFLDEQLSEKDFQIQRLQKDFKLASTANIKILWPSEQFSQDVELGDNDKSAVCLIEFAGRKILLCSDIEKFAQRELFRLNPNLKADIVVVPHHGLATTLDTGFLESLDAGILIFSCGKSEYERQQTIRQKSKGESFYTPIDGAITLCINKDGAIK